MKFLKTAVLLTAVAASSCDQMQEMPSGSFYDADSTQGQPDSGVTTRSDKWVGRPTKDAIPVSPVGLPPCPPENPIPIISWDNFGNAFTRACENDGGQANARIIMGKQQQHIVDTYPNINRVTRNGDPGPSIITVYSVAAGLRFLEGEVCTLTSQTTVNLKTGSFTGGGINQTCAP
jgi:hypothetical protein